MIVDVATMQAAEGYFDFSIAAEDINLENETARLIQPVRVSGKVTKRSIGWNVAGDINTKAQIECSRCLQPIEKLLEIPFRAVFVTDEFYSQAKETELRGEDLEVAVFAGDRIDLTELAREQILLELPEQIFCRDECKGLCDKCGANRNLVNCSCAENDIDPRWSALKNLK